MALSISSSKIGGILLDIEGTTTPIQFVYDVLYPFARHQLPEYLKARADRRETQEIVRALKLEHADDARNNLATPQWPEGTESEIASVVAYVNWLMDQDRKSTALKALQGRVWHEGYTNGKLHGEVFPDVQGALERWKQLRLDIRIFSSGSELAQRLLFGSTVYGDLTLFLNGYFDTNIGPKTDRTTYTRIATDFNLTPAQILFISDVTRELDAARQGGMTTLLCMRPGNHPQVMHGHPAISTFSEILD